MSYSYHTLAMDKTGATRKVMHDGREHIVAPVIILVEGVHRGSGGSLYYPAEVLKNVAQFWNGMPVPVHHPELNGTPISCNSPDIIEKQSVGRLWNVQYEAEPKPRLKGELYIDVQKAKTVSLPVIEALQNNTPLEVSTGLFSTDDPTPGKWNEETYDAIVKDMRPDHLALLPGGKGACSWKDGCGVRANEEGDVVWRKIAAYFKPLFDKLKEGKDVKLVAQNEDGSGAIAVRVNSDDVRPDSDGSLGGASGPDPRVIAAQRAAKIFEKR